MEVPVHVKHVFTWVPKFACKFLYECEQSPRQNLHTLTLMFTLKFWWVWTESPSLERSIWKRDGSWDPSICSLISSRDNAVYWWEPNGTSIIISFSGLCALVQDGRPYICRVSNHALYSSIFVCIIDRGNGQNVVSFIGLFCKRDL